MNIINMVQKKANHLKRNGKKDNILLLIMLGLSQIKLQLKK